MENFNKRKLHRAVLAGSLAVSSVVGTAQVNVTSASFPEGALPNVNSCFTKTPSKDLLKVVVKKILPCVVVTLEVVLFVTYIWRKYMLLWKEQKKIKKFFEVEECHEALNKNVKKVINFLEKYSEHLGFKDTVIEIPGSLVSEFVDESYDIFSEKPPLDENLEDAKKQNKVKFKILRIIYEKNTDACCLELKMKQNGVWLNKIYKTRYINKKHLIEFFNYVLEKSSNKNNLEYKLKFEIKDGDAYLVKIKKETNQEVGRISMEEAEKSTTVLESIIELCYEKKLKGIFEKTFIFNRMPEKFRNSGNICEVIFLFLNKHAKDLGIKLGDEDGMTFKVKGAEAANFLYYISDDFKNQLRNLEKVKFKIFSINDKGYIDLRKWSEDKNQYEGLYSTKWATTNVVKIVDFVNFLLKKANEERKEKVEFKLEKVVKGQNTHVKLVKTEKDGSKQEFLINKKLVNECKNLDDMFVEDLSENLFCLNIEDEFNLDLDDAENKKLNLNFELNDDEIQKIDGEEPFFEDGEKFEL